MFIGAPGSSNAAFSSVDDDTIEIAQANTPAGEPIGQITAFQGTVFITHPDGTKVQAADGTSIFQGDVVETETGGAIGITFADDSTFSLAENGSMVIDEMVYDPGTQSGRSALSVAEGVFTFVSGQIAKTDVEAMTITTPVAVIGIRGTAGGGKAGPEGTSNTFTMFQDPGGTVGEMVIKTLGGTQVLNTPLQTTQMASKFVPPTIPVTLPFAVVQGFYAKAAAFGPKSVFQGPAQTGPAPDTPPAQGDADAVIAAAMDDAAEAEIQAALAADPLVFGTGDSIEGVLDTLVLDLSGGLGLADPLGAGLGGGNLRGGFGFFGDEGDDFLLGGGGEDRNFFELILDDPFFDLTGGFFFQEELFFVDDFFFDDDPEFFFEDEFFFEGFVDDDFFEFDPVVFGEEFDLTGGNDNFTGNTSNTEYILDQTLFGPGVYGGTDIINDAGGTRDRITFEGVDNVIISMTGDSGDASRVQIKIATNTGAFNITNTGGVTTPLSTPDNIIDISKQVEDLQALDSDFANFDSGGVLLFGALNVTSSETGYIVAGSDAQNDVIDMSSFNTAATIGSIIFGKGGNDTLTGTSSEDDIIGGAGDDILDGDGGINVIDGGSGNDTINVTVTTSTNDIDGDIGTDTLSYSGLLNTTISTFNFGTFGSLAVSREVSSTVVGGDVVFSVEILNGGQGDDVFNFNTISLGFTNINGGLGNDSFIFNTAGAQIAAVIDGNAGTNTITLNAATFLAGSGGVNSISSITGSAGNDTIKFVGAQTGVNVDLNGGIDNVILDTGAGANVITISDTENITGGAGADTITLGAVQSTGTIDLAGGTDVLNLAAGTNALSLTGIETINGSSGNDTLTITNAQSSGTTVDLGLGNTDTLNLAGGGNTLTVKNLEILNGGAGNDVITSGTTLSITGTTYDLGGGIDTLNLGIGSNTLIISNTETITGNSSNDTITLGAAITGATVDLAGGTADVLNLFNGTNSITVSNTETINGGTGADTITLGAAQVSGTIDLGGGADVLNLAAGTNTLTVSNTETITGNTGADTITLGAAQTSGTIDLGAGTDTITLAAGANTLTITDTETINTGTGVDIVTYTGASNTTINASTGLDTFNLNGSGSHTVSYGARNEFGDTLTGFSTATDVIDTSGGSDFNFTQAAAAIAATTFINDATALTISASTDAGFEFTQATASMAGTATAATALSLAQTTLVGNLVTGTNITTSLIVLYDNATTANAAVFVVTDANADGATTANEIELITFIDAVGADALAAGNFTV